MSRYRPAHVSTEEIEKYIDHINEVPEFAKAPKISVTPLWANWGFGSEQDYLKYKYSLPLDESVCEHCQEKIYRRKSNEKFDYEKQKPVSMITAGKDYPQEYPMNKPDEFGAYSLHFCFDDDNLPLEKRFESISDTVKMQAEVHKKLMEKIIFLESCTEKRKFYVEDAIF